MALNHPYRTTSELPREIPIFPLAGALLLPRVELPLNIFEPRYISLVDMAMNSHRLIGMVQPALDGISDEAAPQLANIGCLGRITGFQETGDGRYYITLTGIIRYQIEKELPVATLFRQARANYDAYKDDLHPGDGEEGVNRRKLLETFQRYLDAHHMEADWRSVNDAPNEPLVNALSMMAPYGPREKQALLEALTLNDRAEMLIAMTELSLTKEEPGAAEHLN
ncbi:MAG: LON peptidase substrate-binding domain-containing protein [Pseudomonadota bacterium]